MSYDVRAQRTDTIVAQQANQVLRQTYMLLSMTLAFSAAMAGVAMVINMPPLPWFVVLIGYVALFFLTNALRNSAAGVLAVFALTGFMGLTLGPIISLYIGAFSNGSQIVAMALGGTAAIFLGLSGYALTTKRDFTGIGPFLFVGILVAFCAGLAAIIFSIPALSLAVSSMFMLLMGGLILYQTQQIVRGGETNYIMATVTLYVSIYNLFLSLLQLLGFGFGED